MRKRLFLFLLLSLLLILPTAAADSNERVYDDASLFTVEEAQQLREQIARVRESTGLDFAVVTTNDAGGHTAKYYADEFYDSHGFGAGEQNSGAVFLIDMDNREAYISTDGYAIELYEDHIEDMLDDIFEYLPDGYYYESAAAFLDSAERYALGGVRGADGFMERYDPVTDTMVVFHGYQPVEILIAVIVPLAAAGAVFLAVYLVYNRKEKTVPYPFRQQSRLQLTRSDDQFINRTLVTRHIDTSSHSGGRSSGGGSGGRSGGGGGHGGGGRSF